MLSPKIKIKLIHALLVAAVVLLAVSFVRFGPVCIADSTMDYLGVRGGDEVKTAVVQLGAIALGVILFLFSRLASEVYAPQLAAAEAEAREAAICKALEVEREAAAEPVVAPQNTPPPIPVAVSEEEEAEPQEAEPQPEPAAQKPAKEVPDVTAPDFE